MRRTAIGAAGAVAGAFVVLATHGATVAHPVATGTGHPDEVAPDDGGTAPAPGGTGTGAPPLPTGATTVTGPAVDTPYGPVQVKVSFANGKIADVQAVQTPNDRRRSVAINGYAAPILRQEVLQAQSANVDLVSGATTTSEAYLQSLQAAIDRAGR
ncbi:MAG TPA: FMN-binding protein [Micromonosporaceae bacterium]